MPSEVHTVVGVDDVSRPLLSLGVEEPGGVDLGPDSALAVERRSSGRCLGDVDLNGALVSAGDGVLASALIVLVPFEGDLLLDRICYSACHGNMSDSRWLQQGSSRYSRLNHWFRQRYTSSPLM